MFLHTTYKQFGIVSQTLLNEYNILHKMIFKIFPLEIGAGAYVKKYARKKWVPIERTCVRGWGSKNFHHVGAYVLTK